MAHKDGPPAHFEVDDAEAAFHRMEEATRRLMSVPKKKVDSAIAKSRQKRKPKK